MEFLDGASTVRFYTTVDLSARPNEYQFENCGINRTEDFGGDPTTDYPQSPEKYFNFFFNANYTPITTTNTAVGFDAVRGEWYHELEFVLLDDSDAQIILDPYTLDETMEVRPFATGYDWTIAGVGIYVDGVWEQVGSGVWTGFVDFGPFTLTQLALPAPSEFWTAFNGTFETVDTGG